MKLVLRKYRNHLWQVLKHPRPTTVQFCGIASVKIELILPQSIVFSVFLSEISHFQIYFQRAYADTLQGIYSEISNPFFLEPSDHVTGGP